MSERQDRLRRVVERLTPDQLRTFAASLDDPGDVALLEEVIGDMASETAEAERTADYSAHWRSDPARMAHYLTDGDYQLWPYVTLLSEAFARAIKGDDPRQQWQIGSQYGKTSALKWGVIWALDRNPKLRIMYVSYDANKAAEEAGDVRDWVEQHQELLRFRLRSDARARGRWRTEDGGGLYATGIGGGITGYAEDVILMDDLIKGWEAAHSLANRDKVWNVYRSMIRMRLQSISCPIIDVGTRWHQDDHHARLVAQSVPGEDWTIIRLPTVAEAPDPLASDPLLRVPDPLGREPGQILEPRRFPAEEVQARALVLGPYLTAAMEQQRPAPAEGTEVLREWFQVETTLPPKADEAIGSWDMKLKDNETGDFVVGQCWWRVGGGYWLMDQLRGQWNEATTKVAIALMAVRHPEMRSQYVENSGNGPELMAELRRGDANYVVPDRVADDLGMSHDEREAVGALMQRGLSSLIPVPPKGSKSVRMRAVSGVLAGMNVHVPSGAPWLPLYLEEMAAFPHGKDDQVDATSQALSKLSKPPSVSSAASDSPTTPGVPLRPSAVPGGGGQRVAVLTSGVPRR